MVKLKVPAPKTPLQNPPIPKTDYRVGQLVIPPVNITGTKAVKMNTPGSKLTFLSDADLRLRKRVNRKLLGPNGHWEFCRQLGAGIGFIYLVEDAANQKMYIGKKKYYGRGDANSGKESNWKWYTTSSIPVNRSIKNNGKEYFRFYVLDEYRTAGGLAHAEVWSIMYVEALINKHEWYNSAVDAIQYQINEPISILHRERLKAIIAGDSDTLEIFGA